MTGGVGERFRLPNASTRALARPAGGRRPLGGTSGAGASSEVPVPPPSVTLVLILVGAVGGFLAGLVGVGGGIVFGPALFFAYQAAGVEDPTLTPLTLGTSLLCTFAASASGTVGQLRAGAVDRRTAAVVGAFAAVAVVLVGRFVSTQPWYDKDAFQLVLGVLLAVVVARMLTKRADVDSLSTEGARRGAGALAVTGGAAGTVSALAGIGGGVVLVPVLNGLVRLPLRVAAGTSTAAITLITAVGVATYAVLGWDAGGPAGAVGYVDVRGAAALAVPAVVTARLGVSTAHRVDVRAVRLSFAAFAGVVAARLLWNALS